MAVRTPSSTKLNQGDHLKYLILPMLPQDSQHQIWRILQTQTGAALRGRTRLISLISPQWNPHLHHHYDQGQDPEHPQYLTTK
jgi:hypothetical protein